MSPSNVWLSLGIAATAALVSANSCDLYAAGNTPCVAAHSTTRALFSAYSGALYEVKRQSDGTTRKIKPLIAGGVAHAAAQDAFCESTSCVITIIYDQSGHGNDLRPAPPGGAANGTGEDGFDQPADASAAPVTLNGQEAYGVYISPGMGYRIDETNGIATGNQPEGIYAVLDGTHYNDGCCFDYGNAETDNDDDGNGHMEAIYFGNNSYWGSGSGSGPWIMADMENGLFSGSNPKENPNDPTITYRFLTAIVKGKPNHWAIQGGNAQSGPLSTFYNGPRPSVPGYNPMHKEGAIILGIGGDNSNSAEGTFYEGAMTYGYPSAKTEGRVQADIVNARYAV